MIFFPMKHIPLQEAKLNLKVSIKAKSTISFSQIFKFLCVSFIKMNYMSTENYLT